MGMAGRLIESPPRWLISSRSPSAAGILINDALDRPPAAERVRRVSFFGILTELFEAIKVADSTEAFRAQ